MDNNQKMLKQCTQDIDSIFFNRKNDNLIAKNKKADKKYDKDDERKTAGKLPTIVGDSDKRFCHKKGDHQK